jgi:predicted transposase YdaD
MDPVHQPHDALFKFVFGSGDLEPCRELLARALPAAIARAIDWSTLARADEDLLDPDLSERRADLLLTAMFAGRRAYLYALGDHKSWDDPETLFVFFCYMARIWQRHRKKHGKGSRLPFILPFVLHHGPAPWASPRFFQELFDFQALGAEGAAAMRPLVPNFTFVLEELAGAGEDEIAAKTALLLVRVAYLCYRFLHGTRPDEAQQALERLHDLLQRLHDDPAGQSGFRAITFYVASVADVPRDVLAAVFRRISPRAEEMIMEATGRAVRAGIEQGTKLGRQEGLEEGIKEGIKEGRKEGQATVLLALLQQRFGTLPETAIARVRTATAPEFEAIVHRVLTARTLAEVLGP